MSVYLRLREVVVQIGKIPHGVYPERSRRVRDDNGSKDVISSAARNLSHSTQPSHNHTEPSPSTKTRRSFTIMVIRYASAVLTLSGALALILGLFLWTGTDLTLVSMHMLLGFLAVGSLWVIGIGQCFSQNRSWVIAGGALLVGALTVVLGLHQSTLMIGESHWVIQVTHLLLGVLTIGLGHMGTARFRKSVAG
jgi:hypothetical protein